MTATEKLTQKKLVKSLKREKAVLTIFSDEDQLEEFIDKHESKFEKVKANFKDLLDHGNNPQPWTTQSV